MTELALGLHVNKTQTAYFLHTKHKHDQKQRERNVAFFQIKNETWCAEVRGV